MTEMPIGIDRHVPGFASGIAFAIDEPAPVNDGCADAGADHDIDHAVAFTPSAKMKLAQGRHFGVMIQLDRQTKLLLQYAAEGLYWKYRAGSLAYASRR